LNLAAGLTRGDVLGFQLGFKQPQSQIEEQHQQLEGAQKSLIQNLHAIWQWGIVDDDLIAKMEHLGNRMQYFKSFGQFFYLSNFRDHAVDFTR
jgi:hypothetical protein